ncbi:MAG: gliding motility lipoprotein GldD [Prolixibacteraceae bacterium]|nr:gliding motility lipoprotein GldD [Prolixibacteraceae bacterium]
MNLRQITILLLMLFFIIACKKDNYTPKPRGYFRIDFPEKTYQSFDEDAPFTFQYPAYSKIQNEKFTNAEPYWYNITIPENNVSIHLSYKKIEDNLNILSEDSRELAYKHSIKASAINEKLYINHEQNVFGTIYEISGNAASPFQFHLTDSTKNFIRGSFYIKEQPNYDSLKPVIEFVEEDIYNLIETFSWK